MLDRVEVRYDGAESDQHVIGANELAESLIGFARIFGTAYHFTLTGEYVRKAPAQEVRVLVGVPEAKCYNVLFEMWEWGKQQQVFQGFAGNIAVAVVTYIVARAADRTQEMKHLAQALQTSLAQNGQRDQAALDRAMATIEKMADALRPAARLAVAPIGGSCKTVRIGGDAGITLNEEDKARIVALSETDITSERQWVAVLTELDRENATAKARLDWDDEGRVPVRITDPAFFVADNAYVRAFVTGQPITLIGKAELSDGEIKRLHISNSQ